MNILRQLGLSLEEEVFVVFVVHLHSTSIDIRPGQMVVVGKTSFEGNQALIAIITAKIVE
jgi:hypothetical protein